MTTDNIQNIIEAVLFASGNPVAIKDVAEKLDISESAVMGAAERLKEKYGESSGILILFFNNKLQLSTNPTLKDAVSSVLNPIKEKEFTRTILECAAIIAYKQPITKGELEAIRGISSDYAVSTLLELQMIEVIGRKNAVGRPLLYATTDNFLKRFKLQSLFDLPDYDTLMQQIATLHAESTPDDNYLYSKEAYDEDAEKAKQQADEESARAAKKKKGKDVSAESLSDIIQEDFELPDFLKDLPDNEIIKIG